MRAGFALFLREKTRVGVFFPAHVREKTFMRKSPCFARAFLMEGFPTDKTPGQGIGRGSCAKKEILIAEKARPCRQLLPDGFILAKILLKINVFSREIEQEFEFSCISV